jgi:hypothetical protein
MVAVTSAVIGAPAAQDGQYGGIRSENRKTATQCTPVWISMGQTNPEIRSVTDISSQTSLSKYASDCGEFQKTVLMLPIEPAHKSKIFAERLKKTQTVTANSVRTWNIVGNDIHLRYGLINYWPVIGQSLNFGHTDPSVGRLVRKVSSLSANGVSAGDS